MRASACARLGDAVGTPSAGCRRQRGMPPARRRWLAVGLELAMVVFEMRPTRAERVDCERDVDLDRRARGFKGVVRDERRRDAQQRRFGAAAAHEDLSSAMRTGARPSMPPGGSGRTSSTRTSSTRMLSSSSSSRYSAESRVAPADVDGAPPSFRPSRSQHLRRAPVEGGSVPRGGRQTRVRPRATAGATNRVWIRGPKPRPSPRRGNGRAPPAVWRRGGAARRRRARKTAARGPGRPGARRSLRRRP
mmetsp:Transcript_25319/g.87407  ORF Transcript_25319/g.87407 Transcript_25319/m.87407 type:complete len:248 (-) Transcript_25319:1063-1806(-)